MAAKTLKLKSNLNFSWSVLAKALAGLLFLLLPGLIIWAAMLNLQKQIRKERIEFEIPKLQKLVDKSEPIFNPFLQIVHEMKLSHDLLSNRPKLDRYLKEGSLKNEISGFASGLFKQIGYPLEVSACIRDLQQNFKILNFVDTNEVRSNRLTRLTQMMYDINSISGIDRKVEKANILELGQEFQNHELIFWDRHFLTGGEYSFTRHFIRRENKLEFLISIRNKGYFIINILIDMTSLGENSQITQKINNFKDDKTGLAFFASKSTGSGLFKSTWFNGKEGLLTRAIKQIPGLPPKVNCFEIDNHLFLISASRAQSNFTTLACTELPKIEAEKELQILLVIVIIFSLFLAKAMIEGLIFNRYPQVSIKAFILSLFMIICLLPLVGAVYLASEHVITMFKLGINETSNQINSFNTALDLETLDNFRSNLHLFKSLDTVEKLKKYSGIKGDKDFGEIIGKVLNRFKALESPKSDRCKLAETWIYDLSGNLKCYEFSTNNKQYERTHEVDPFLSDLFKRKFKDYLYTHKLVSKPKGAQKDIEIDELKIEFLNDLFLNFFGPDAYFDQKKDIGHLLELKSFDDRNFFYSMPVTEKGKVKYILSHIFDSHSMRSHFPVKKLFSANESCSFVLFGWVDRLLSNPHDVAFYSEKYPDALKLARESHLSRQKLEQQIIGSTNKIIISQPAKYSDYIITTAKTAPNISELKNSLVAEVARLTAIMLTFMALLALVVAKYFQAPIDELTRATGEIIKENYLERVNSRHPDEFSEIASTFNHIARQLQEGKLLSTFVAQSLASELETSTSKAQRKEVSVIFSEITGFKNISPNLSPQEIFELLQKHLVIASEAAHKFGGEIDKMIEDKVMIVFEDGNDQIKSNQRAIRAARMLSKSFAQRTDQKLSIGINTGEVISGIMGSEKVRLAKTVVGDPVNLAARLAAIAETQKGGTIISGQTIAGLKDAPEVEKLSVKTVKGKTQSVEIFAIVEDKI
jgi:class 3 adenylate cyclase